jgi:hypothetical protein
MSLVLDFCNETNQCESDSSIIELMCLLAIVLQIEGIFEVWGGFFGFKV